MEYPLTIFGLGDELPIPWNWQLADLKLASDFGPRQLSKAHDQAGLKYNLIRTYSHDHLGLSWFSETSTEPKEETIARRFKEVVPTLRCQEYRFFGSSSKLQPFNPLPLGSYKAHFWPRTSAALYRRPPHAINTLLPRFLAISRPHKPCDSRSTIQAVGTCISPSNICETAVAVTAVLTGRLVQVLLPCDSKSTLAEALAVNNQHETKSISHRRHIKPRSEKPLKTVRDNWCSFSYKTLAPAGSSSFLFRNAHLPLYK